MSGLNTARIEEIFVGAVDSTRTVGAQLSIIKGGERLDLAAGLADAAAGTALSTDTAMQIGSVTKVFNATLVMSLVDDHRLGLDEPISAYLPDLELADPTAAKTITLRHLLSMSSGLDGGRFLDFGTGDDALEQYVAAQGDLVRHFEPGTSFGYSNAGACIAGHIAAKTAGLPWESLLRSRLTEPSGFLSPVLLDDDLVGRTMSLGHAPGLDKAAATTIRPLLSVDRAQAPSGATFALACPELASFGQMFLRGGIAESGARILSANAVAEMMRSHVDLLTKSVADTWGLGLMNASWDGVEVWGHTGGTIASGAALFFIPRHDTVIAFAANTPATTGALMHAVMGDVLAATCGVRKPLISVSDQGKPTDSSRYTATYSSMGMTVEVNEEDGGLLLAHITSHRIAEELAIHDMPVVDMLVRLVPVARDRFVLAAPDGPIPTAADSDIAFFGFDRFARATNASFTIAFSRQSA